MNLLRCCAGLAMAALLSACAPLHPERPVERARPFDLVGRVADAERDEVWLLTPVGQALAHILGDSQRATFTGSDRSQRTARDIASLTREALGWEFPIELLSWWVQGAIAPFAAIQLVERDEHGRLAMLQQDGWRIAYTHYAAGENGGLPRRLDVSGGTQAIRLVVDTWRRDGESP